MGIDTMVTAAAIINLPNIKGEQIANARLADMTFDILPAARRRPNVVPVLTGPTAALERSSILLATLDIAGYKTLSTDLTAETGGWSLHL
jgi:hypothetical protein